jgi:hypothetical protein
MRTGWADTRAVISTALICQLPAAQAVIRRKISPKSRAARIKASNIAQTCGQLQMMQPSDSMPEGLQRERKGPLTRTSGLVKSQHRRRRAAPGLEELPSAIKLDTAPHSDNG